MAHLPQDELPSEFDVVVDGTGLVQSILAAALARAGKTVLHLDCNPYYGELWASLMHREMQQWMKEYGSHDRETTSPVPHDQPSQPPDCSPSEGESVLKIDRTPTPVSVTNLVELIHTAPEDSCCTPGDSESVKSEGATSSGATGDGAISEGSCATGEGAVTESAVSEGATGSGVTDDGAVSESATGSGATGEGAVSESATGEGAVSESATGSGATGDGVVSESATSSGATGDGDIGEEKEGTKLPIETPPTNSQSSKVTWQSLEPQRRRFNFDLLPKFIYCRGAMVDLLTESSCSRYIEFRAVGGIFNYDNGKIEQVPCSRSDVFSSKVVSMLEKRRMMKFLTFCADFQQHPEEYEEFVSLPFVDFLKRKQLTPNLVQYIFHSIAMVTNNTTTLEGLQATQVFMSSLGRYGNAPFLFPIFGGGELPQAFCRLCAVYGGVYCLHRHVTSIITSTSEDSITSIICSSGQQITCKSVVMSATFLTKTLNFRDTIKVTRLSRAIFVTDSSLQGTDGKLSLITLPPGSLGVTQTVAIRVMQLDHLSNSCPHGTFMVHVQCCSVCETAQQDLEPAARALFSIEDDKESNSSGPHLLWSLYYNLDLHSVDQSQVSTLECPRGLYMTSEPDETIGYERAASEARELYSQMCPGEDFLPHPPSPDDIVFDDSSTDTKTPPISGEAPPTDATASQEPIY